MGYIYTNSKEYMEKTVKKERKPLEPYFATVQANSKKIGRTLRIMLSKRLVSDLGVGKYAIVGYDKDLRRLYVEPTIKPKGALRVGLARDGNYNYRYQMLSATALFDFCNAEFSKAGRYKAAIAIDKSFAENYFDLPIEVQKRKEK